MDVILLTGYQALQLLALGPCLFMMFFLCVTTHRVSQIIVPFLYFLSLACSFVLPLSETFNFSNEYQAALLMGESLSPSLSFLLIVQFLRGKMPPLAYWTILAVPVVGGSSITYATLLVKSEICIYEHLCTLPTTFKQLYVIFSSSLTFLLTMAVYNRLAKAVDGNIYQREHKFAVVLALIVLNLAVLGIDLMQISGYSDPERTALAITVVRIGFIYIVLTSVFRVFDRSIDIAFERVPHIRPQEASARDKEFAERIKQLLTQEKIYRDMEMGREKLAAKLAVSEHYLSHVINRCFNQNFNTLINEYRVTEAKLKLAGEKTAITVIGFDVGFSSIPSFNRVFKQSTGVSPTEYRLSQRDTKK